MTCCNNNCDQGRDCPVRSYPRTMRQAFGPETDDRLEPMPDPRPSLAGVAIGLLCLCLALLLIEVVNK